ncbi:MAG: NlpC/P60 family protein [Actinomycetota bacterium]
MNLRPGRFLPILIVGLAAPLLAPTPAPGQPIDDLRAEAAQLEKDLQASNANVAAVAEQLSTAEQKLGQAEAAIGEAQQRIDAAQARIGELRVLIAERAAAIYRTALNSDPLEVVNTDETSDAAARSKYTDAATAKDDALVDELSAAKDDLEAERAAAESAREAARQERDAIAAAKAAAEAAAADYERLRSQVTGKIEDELARQTAARAAAALAAAPKPSSGGAPAVPSGPPPLGNGGAGAAVSYASAQVGKPYCNTNPDRFGPNCYDCSGLTYSSWQAGGLTIPTTSGAQGSAYPHVPLDQLQPGDLITTSSWSAHVGIWVGGGYVHATTPGNPVKFVAGGSVVDAVRPG